MMINEEATAPNGARAAVVETATAPAVSVLIPVYNRELYLADCIQSALDQTWQDLEIVVVDNASTDGSWAICQEYAAKDSRVRIFRNETNLGPVRNWLRCMEEARGLYGKLLFSDDLIASRFLEQTVPRLRDENVGFVWSDIEVGESPGQGSIYWWRGTSGTCSGMTFLRESLLGGKVPGSPGAALFRLADLRRNLKLEIPSLEGTDFTRFGAGPDVLLFLLTAEAYPKVAYVAEPLAFFRSHRQSITVLESRNMWSHYFQARIWFASRLSTKGFSLPGSLLQRGLAYGWQCYCRRNGPEPMEKFCKRYLENPPTVGRLAYTLMLLYRFRMKCVRLASRYIPIGVEGV